MASVIWTLPRKIPKAMLPVVCSTRPETKGRLQVIVGYNDRTCLLQHSLAFLRACEDAGVQPDYFVYPGQDHNMMGQDMIHLHERITRYFDDYLKPAVK